MLFFCPFVYQPHAPMTRFFVTRAGAFRDAPRPVRRALVVRLVRATKAAHRSWGSTAKQSPKIGALPLKGSDADASRA